MVDSTKLPNVDINAIVTDLNNKLDKDMTNIAESIPQKAKVLATLGFSGGQNAITLFNDIVIQWGEAYVSSEGGITVTFPKPYNNTDYIACVTHNRNGVKNTYNIAAIYKKNTDSMHISILTASGSNTTGYLDWFVIGKVTEE